MRTFKIVFKDGKSINVAAVNFIRACVFASYRRAKQGATLAKELLVDEKKCTVR